MTSNGESAPVAAMRSPVAVPVALILFTAAYIAIGLLTLDSASRNVPLLASGATLLLAFLELFAAWSRRNRGASADRDPDWSEAQSRAELRVLLSVAAGLGGIALVGFLIALPLYMTGAIYFIGRHRAMTALATGLLTTAAIYLAFEYLLSYRLYPGLLFS